MKKEKSFMDRNIFPIMFVFGFITTWEILSLYYGHL